MKKILTTLVILGALVSISEATMSYECSFEATNAGFLKGTYVKVSANSKEEAERKAIEKIKKIRGKDTVIKYLKCK